MVALGVQIVLQQLLSEPDMKAWGWRIPFIIGAMGAVAVLWLRRTMDESEQFSNIKSQKRESAGTVRALMKHPKAVLTVVSTNIRRHCCILYVHNIFTKVHGKHSRIPKEIVSWINFVALLIFVVLQPIAGLLSDKIGRRPLLMAFGILGTLLTAPIFFFMEKRQNQS